MDVVIVVISIVSHISQSTASIEPKIISFITYKSTQTIIDIDISLYNVVAL